jgi:hypothetical protein
VDAIVVRTPKHPSTSRRLWPGRRRARQPKN